MVTQRPDARRRLRLCFSSDGKTRSFTFEIGHTVRGMRRATSSATSAGSSSHRIPWSIRETSRTSSASRTYAGGPSSPACATVRKPSARAGEERSEEHTSELQSHLNLVCRLLLVKKKYDA